MGNAVRAAFDNGSSLRWRMLCARCDLSTCGMAMLLPVSWVLNHLLHVRVAKNSSFIGGTQPVKYLRAQVRTQLGSNVQPLVITIMSATLLRVTLILSVGHMPACHQAALSARINRTGNYTNVRPPLALQVGLHMCLPISVQAECPLT